MSNIADYKRASGMILTRGGQMLVTPTGYVYEMYALPGAKWFCKASKHGDPLKRRTFADYLANACKRVRRWKV
jgi:hypothetical protein